MGSPRDMPKRSAVSRRQFLKWTAAAGAASGLVGMGVLSALGIVRGPVEPPPVWEVEPGVVDYDLVPSRPSGPTPGILKVANWYDYWPGKFEDDFREYMRARGHSVEIELDTYESNEELFHWLTLDRRRYDLIFPSNYFVDLLKKAGMIYTLNEDWLPNLGPGFSNMMQGLVATPSGNPYDRRLVQGEPRWVSVPYFWGTTGLGFRTDKIPREDVEELGYELLWMPSYQPRQPGWEPVQLRKKMRMLDDLRDVIGAGLKMAGWANQEDLGLEPSGVPPPAGVQWTTNETEPSKVNAARDWLFRNKPLLFGYDSVDQGPSLLREAAVINQAWSGDIMYAIRPDQPTQYPVDYVIPRQGSTWWVDCAAIQSTSRNLWLAHQLINFIHDVEENVMLTKWNLYSTPNLPAFESERPKPSLVFEATGYDMRLDPRLYPNILAPDDFRVCDMSQDIGLENLLTLYNPLWFDLVAV